MYWDGDDVVSSSMFINDVTAFLTANSEPVLLENVYPFIGGKWLHFRD